MGIPIPDLWNLGQLGKPSGTAILLSHPKFDSPKLDILETNKFIQQKIIHKFMKRHKQAAGVSPQFPADKKENQRGCG